MAASSDLTTAPLLPTIWRLSLPNMFAMVATALVSVAETVYVGVLGTAPLAGMALVFPLIMLQQMLSAGSMGGGIASAISRALGAGQQGRADALVLHAVLISAVLGLFFSALVLIWGRPILVLIGGREAALEEALAYAVVAFAGAQAIWLLNAFASSLRGAGDMKTPSATLLLVAGGQIVLGGWLGLGWGPVPRLGMAGIALGQVLAFALGAAYLYRHLRSGRARVRLVFSARPDGWSRLFTEEAQVLAYARSYFRWVAPAYGFFALGLCLYFAAQGAGKLLGPVLAGTARLLLVAVGGWLLVQGGAPVWSMFALISAAMLLYGLITALAVYYVRWGD